MGIRTDGEGEGTLASPRMFCYVWLPLAGQWLSAECYNTSCLASWFPFSVSRHLPNILTSVSACCRFLQLSTAIFLF
jgi:hypothetical protein